jgi:hypothetical protein
MVREALQRAGHFEPGPLANHSLGFRKKRASRRWRSWLHLAVITEA